MELWIRSQDKHFLTKINELGIENEDVDEYTIKNYKNNDTTILGRYTTKERALEVLDEIQKYLTPTIQMLDETIGNKKVCQIGTIMTIVYEMPKE